MDSTTIQAQVLISEAVYVSLPTRPELVREYAGMAASSMNEKAGERGRVIGETPRLVEQRMTGLGYVELTFQADTVKR